jgi:hypothetical protein
MVRSGLGDGQLELDIQNLFAVKRCGWVAYGRTIRCMPKKDDFADLNMCGREWEVEWLA